MWMFWGAVLGALGVALGAFGAHGLPDQLNKLDFSPEEVARRIAIFETAVRYQMYHALALLAVGLLAFRGGGWLNSAGWTMGLGVLIFSGLLYVLVFAGDAWRWLGAVVPFGGLLMIAGWILLAVAAWKHTR
jgi:uncharacterized membrane protein YgdD (TMEM256/DUF423 family)